MEDVEIFLQSECPICDEVGVNPAWPQGKGVYITTCQICEGVTVVDTSRRNAVQLLWGMITSVVEFYDDLFSFVGLLYSKIRERLAQR